MRLRVHIPSDHLQERRYVLHVLLEVFLGLPYEIIEEEGASHYKIHCPAGIISIKDSFFASQPPDGVTYTAQVLPENPKPAATAGLEGCVVLYGEESFHEGPEGIRCGIDIPGSAFFMLTRWEESIPGVKDSHDRFVPRSSVAYSFLGRPVVDEYTRLLKNLLIKGGVAEESFRKHHFTKNVSCDADYPFYYPDAIAPVRHLARTLIKKGGKGFTREGRRGLQWWMGKEEDPFDRFDWMMDQAERCGERMRFFFMSGSSHFHDPPKHLEDKRVLSLVKKILKRGHKIGFHPSYNAAYDKDLFLAEWREMKHRIPEVESVCRQHYLRFSLPLTWQIQEEAGMSLDSTMGYAGEIGFRCGTCRDFPVFDIENRKMLQLWEQPLHLMDVTLKNYFQGSVADVIQQVEALVRQTKEHNGALNFLWHNSSFELDGWEEYESVFLTLLNA